MLLCLHHVKLVAKLNEAMTPTPLTLLYILYLCIIRAACSLAGFHVGIFQTEIINYSAFLSELRDTSTAKLYFSVLRAMFYSCLKRFQQKMCIDITVICTWFHSNTQWVSRLDDCSLAKLMLLIIFFFGGCNYWTKWLPHHILTAGGN